VEQPLPAILVVDDDDAVRELIATALIEADFDVTTAATGWDAVALVEEKRFDLIIADIRLPGDLDGLEMARHARRRHPELKFLFISGKNRPVICDPRLDDFISKPFLPSLLVGCVWKVLCGNQPYPRVEVAR